MSQETTKSFCRTCKRETNHQVIAKHNLHEKDEKHGTDYWAAYQIVTCLGCEAIGYRSVFASSDDFDFETGQAIETINTFPDPSEQRQPVNGDEHFPSETLRVYHETLVAISHNLPILTAVGLRAIVESVCLDLKTGTGNLKDGIDALAAKGHLSTNQADYLHKHRFMGNVAAHEIRPPKPDQLIHALDIAETLLKTIYVLPALAAKLDAPAP
jgi:hypothetical protein